MKINLETIKRRSVKFIFWSWHLIYVIIAIALIIPFIFVPMFESIWDDRTPIHYIVYALFITLLPFVSIALGATTFKGNYKNLIRYFYGFEMPLLFFILVKISTFRELNLNTVVLIINVVIALVAWLYFLWEENKQGKFPDSLLNKPLALAGSTLIAIVGLYCGVLFSVFLFPLGVSFFKGVFEFLSHIGSVDIEDILYGIINPLIWLTILFFFFTTTLFLALPLVMVAFYLGQFKKFIGVLVAPKAIAVFLSVILINVTLFIYGQQQPQQAIFTLLEEQMQQQDNEVALLEKADQIKVGLMNAYLAPYRYTSSTLQSRSVARNYKKILGFNDEMAEIPQVIFNFLASPLFYQGDIKGDKLKAEKYYEAFFDAQIQKSEREIIIDSMKQRWQMGVDNEAGLLDVNSHLVHSASQSIEIKEQQGVATITITEELVNKTYRNKEAVIHFSLPDDAAVTGLWLSTNKREPKMFSYVLAPKGAAQAVYKAEVKRRVDPALLEKVGPNQYRLRVFPVPPKNLSSYFQMQLEYQTLVNSEGKWALPRVLEKRNIFWDKETQRTINSAVVKLDDEEQWIPPAVAMTKISYHQPLEIQQESSLIKAIPRERITEKVMLSNKPIAVLIDGSFSMNEQKQTVQNALKKVKALSQQVDFYFCQKSCREIDGIDQVNFFGNSQLADQLAAFTQVVKPDNYAVILLLSDAGSYELEAKASTKTFEVNAPVWLVHLGKSLPYAYDDKVLDLIYRTKGGISQSITEALLRNNPVGITQALKLASNTKILSVSKDRVWITSSEQSNVSNPVLQKIVAAQQIKQLMKVMDMQKLNNLDAIHAFAKDNDIVTHYSSMLVLVNDRQKEALKKAEESIDRFEREVETGKKSTLNPDDPFAVPAFPEPEEWALLIIMVILLTVAYVRRKWQVSTREQLI